MATVSERLRRPIVAGIDRMPGTCCAQAADTIDALVAALEGMLNVKNGDERENALAALALARKGG